MINRLQSQAGLGLYIDESTAAALSADDRVTAIGSWGVPPAVVYSEAKRRVASADLTGSDVRGAGLPWPLAAQVSARLGAARLPAAIAWRQMLLGNRPWLMQSPDGPFSETEHAKAVALLAVSSQRHLPHPREAGTALVVPNTLAPESQEQILGGLRDIENPRLLWRPIAAALAWLERERELVSRLPRTERSAGFLLSVHAGLDAFEVSAIELIDETLDDGSHRTIPARRLPSAGEVADIGLTLAEDAAGSAAGGDAGRAWNLLWLTDALNGDPGSLGPRTTVLHGEDAAGAFSRGLSAAIKSIDQPRSISLFTAKAKSGLTALRCTLDHSPPDQSPLDWSAWTSSLRERLPRPVVGVVATGPLARHPRGDTIVQRLLLSIGLSKAPVHVPSDSGLFLASGAAVYVDRIARGEPGYLDTLPIIETLVTRRGEPAWIDLTDQAGKEVGARYVRGNRVWKRRSQNLGIGVRQENVDLRLTLFREGSEHVRESLTTFAEPVAEDTEVDLEVSMDPGQGLPKLVVRPLRPQAFAGRRVQLDWSRAEDTGKTKHQAEDEIPRTNPPLEPRRASIALWRQVEPDIRRFLESSPKSRGAIAQSLRGIADHLRQTDIDMANERPPVHATAVSSEGHAPDLSRTGGRVLSDLAIRLDEIIASRPKADLRDETLRCAAYISADGPELQRFLRDSLSSSDEADRSLLYAYGNCLRDPEDIELFARCFVKATPSGGRPSNDWLRAMSRILQYRENAMERISSTQAEDLVRIGKAALEEQIAERSLKYIYRHGSLCIVYALRRRRYDDAFLPPASRLAMDVKRQFERVIELDAEGRLDLIGGFVDVRVVTQKLIDYIDRRGRGTLSELSGG